MQTMSAKESSCEPRPSDLLSQLEHILESDPLIDEVGLIHPSQFLALSAEAGTPFLPESADGRAESEVSECNPSDTVFWIRDHKLGISTQALLPLYNAAKYAFMAAYQMLNNVYLNKDDVGDETLSSCSSSVTYLIESEVMKHSRALLMLSCDFGAAWNSRKLVVSKKQHFSVLMDELLLSALVLSYSPKSEKAWSHRRWVIKMIAGKCSNVQEIVEKESQLVKNLAEVTAILIAFSTEKSKMNYRAWYHRSWLVPYMSRGQVLHELNKSRDWAGLHVADNSCFHYRSRLMLRMLEDSFHKQDPIVCPGYDAELHKVWKSLSGVVYVAEELDWDEILVKRYIGREALWLHRRFLSLYWIKHFATDLYAIDMFVDSEIQLFRSNSSIPHYNFEDHCAQAIFSATYILWLTKHMYESLGIELGNKLQPGEVETVLKKVCPEKAFLWDSLRMMMCGRK
ncbi:hypothetical protein LguiA_016594 [Lonicera macranthoides]